MKPKSKKDLLTKAAAANQRRLDKLSREQRELELLQTKHKLDRILHGYTLLVPKVACFMGKSP